MPDIDVGQQVYLQARLNPQLLLNLKLLQMPSPDLARFIRDELETNPVLEETEEMPAPGTPASDMEGLPAERESEPALQPAEDSDNFAVKEEPELNRLEGAIDNGEIALVEFLQDTGYLPAGSFDEAPEPEGDAIEPPAGDSGRIRDAILPQIRSYVAEEDMPITELIIDNLNEDGFLVARPVELAQRLGVSEKRVENVLVFIRHLEGGGIAARDLREALLCQLEVIGFDPASVEYRIVSVGCDLMLRRHFHELAHKLSCAEERIHEAMTHIGQLDPRPGARFTGENPGFVQSDFCVEWVGDRLSFYPIDSWVPRLRLSVKYREMLAHPRGVPRDELEFARLKFQKALMLLKGIESRRRTLTGVMGHIVRKQQKFFSHGREFLKPMSLKDTAGALNISGSTISRAVQGKYVETAFGILPMRFFFTSGTNGVARHSVKDKIRRIIEAEDKSKPLSDETIVETLAKDGIRLSRRVVAKYRGEMGIACGAERKTPWAAESRKDAEDAGETQETPDALASAAPGGCHESERGIQGAV